MDRLKELLSPYTGLPREIYFIFWARIINAAGFFVTPLLTIILTQSIGLTVAEAGFYISMSGLLYFPAVLVGGKLADTLGRKKVIIIFDGLGVLMYVVCAWLPPSLGLVYAIMLAGAFMAMAGPGHEALIADLTAPEQRTGAFSLSYLGWNIGFAVGPVIGGMLYQKHLYLIFLGDALTGLIALLIILLLVKETLNRVRAQEQKPETKAGSALKMLAENPVIAIFALILLGYNFAYAQWAFMLPLQVMQKFQDSGAAYFGLLAGFNGLVVMLFTPIVTKVTDKFKHLRRMVYGGLLYAAGLGMLAIVNHYVLFFIATFVFTLGEIFVTISFSPFIAERTPVAYRGRINSFTQLALGLGHILGPLGMGKLLSFVTIEQGWMFLTVWLILCSGLMLRLERYDHNSLAAQK